MSNAVLPSFPGLSWNVARKPVWSTLTKTTVSGREYRAAQWSYPKWQYKLSYEVLRARSALTEMQQLAGFFNARQGSYDTWLYADPDDTVATAQVFGAGTGAQTQFQLVRSFGGYSEPIYDPYTGGGGPSIFLNGVLQVGGYTITNGMVTFSTAPGSGVVLTWTGTFYFRCRFLADLLEFNQFMRQFWELRTLEFITVKP